MQLVLRRNWEAIDGSKEGADAKTVIPAGTHEVERVPCPLGYPCNWLVLKGTLIGASEGSWRQWDHTTNDDFKVTVVD